MKGAAHAVISLYLRTGARAGDQSAGTRRTARALAPHDNDPRRAWARDRFRAGAPDACDTPAVDVGGRRTGRRVDRATAIRTLCPDRRLGGALRGGAWAALAPRRHRGRGRPGGDRRPAARSARLTAVARSRDRATTEHAFAGKAAPRSRLASQPQRTRSLWAPRGRSVRCTRRTRRKWAQRKRARRKRPQHQRWAQRPRAEQCASRWAPDRRPRAGRPGGLDPARRQPGWPPHPGGGRDRLGQDGHRDLGRDAGSAGRHERDRR